MPAAGGIIRQLQAAVRMRSADDRHLVPACDQRPRELVRARATRAPRGREMLMEVEEAQLIEGASWHVGTWARGVREYRVWSIEYRKMQEGTRTRGLEDLYSLLALMCSQPPTANRKPLFPDIGRDVITIASALVPNGCDVIASLPRGSHSPDTRYSILNTLIQLPANWPTDQRVNSFTDVLQPIWRS